MEKKRKSGEGGRFMDAFKSGEFMDNLKLSIEQLKGGGRHVLPTELREKMAELDTQADAFMVAQKKAEEEAMKLKRLTAMLCTDAIAMYSKPADEAVPTKVSDAPPATDQAQKAKSDKKAAAASETSPDQAPPPEKSEDSQSS